MKTLLLSVFILVLAVTVLANPLPEPVVKGTYFMNPLTAMFTESWNPSGGILEIGNTHHATIITADINGYYCTDETDGLWTVSCPFISQTPTLISDTRDENGSGAVTWSVVLSGGSFTMSMQAPWSEYQIPSTPPTPGHFTEFVMNYGHLYMDGVLVGASYDISAIGRFEWYSDVCLVLSSQMTSYGNENTDHVPLPTGYPEFLDPDCLGGTRTEGCWGTIGSTIITVDNCSVPNEEMTWGRIKQLYSD